ncbi:hypothetical protein OIU78_004321 [Salix suchowensis]|nr:hypothetical protein OIU78_004321 [Salix suchowensis]
MEPPILKLTMVQGPREGETLEFRPRSTVRIGRVENGASKTSIPPTAPLSTQVSFLPTNPSISATETPSNSGSQLRSSSNSTFTRKPRSLDAIRGGVSRRIGVRRGIEEEKEYAENLEEENVEKFEVESELIVPESRGKGRPRRAKVMEKELDSVVPAEAKRVNLRSTRSRKNEDCVVLENLGAGCGELGKKVRGGRGRKNNLQEVPAENVQCDVVDVKEKVDLGINVQEEVKEVANEVKVETVEDVHEEITEKEMDLGEKCNDTAKGNGTKEDDVSEAPVGANESSEKGKELPDLEKMTLEEWFDSMEVDLPKQILEVTEEIVEGMRRKAERVREYMIEKKKKQGVGNVG